MAFIWISLGRRSWWIWVITLGLIVTIDNRSPCEASAVYRPTTTRKDHDNNGNDNVAYVSSSDNNNKAPYSEIPYRDRCGMISQVQSSVIQILNTHYEYGKGIHMLHSIVDGLQTDLSARKAKIYDVERRLSASTHTTSGSYTAGIKAIPLPTLDPMTFRSSLAMTRTIQSLNWGLRNLTKMMQAQDEQYDQLDRKYVTLRRKLKRLATEVTAKLKAGGAGDVDDDREDRYMLEHYMRKQTDINSKLLHRIQALEQRIKIQSDWPHVDNKHGVCPAGFVRHFTSCYLFVNVTANWIEAEKHCQRQHPRAHLVSIETRKEAEYLVKYRIHNLEHWSSNYIWIGGNDMADENVWRWVGTKNRLGYTNWRPGQPDNHNDEQHCLYYRADGADPRWDDWHCYAAKLNYVCEINVKA